MISKRAIFLDRDGTINEDPGYLNDPLALRLLPGVGEGLKLLQQLGFELVIVSNQSGISRGLILPEQFEAVHRQLRLLLEPYGVVIREFLLCTHHPDEGCDCRKPSPKLIFDFALAHEYSISESYMVGDKMSDVEAGVAAGVRASFLVRTGCGAQAERDLMSAFPAVRVFDGLKEAAHWIQRETTAE